MSNTFPTAAYNAGSSYYLPIPAALLPYVTGALAAFEDEALWLDDGNYQQAYTAIARLKIAMAAIEHAEQNTVLAGPESGTPGAPAFRRLVFADLPAILFSQLQNIPATYPPNNHASKHATGGADPLTPAAIGAATAGHTHGAHSATHASGGADPLTPAAIGAAAVVHSHINLDYSGDLHPTVGGTIYTAYPLVPLSAPLTGANWNATSKGAGSYTLNAATEFSGIPSAARALMLYMSAAWPAAGSGNYMALRMRGSGVNVAVARSLADGINSDAVGFIPLNASAQFDVFVAATTTAGSTSLRAIGYFL